MKITNVAPNHSHITEYQNGPNYSTTYTYNYDITSNSNNSLLNNHLPILNSNHLKITSVPLINDTNTDVEMKETTTIRPIFYNQILNKLNNNHNEVTKNNIVNDNYSDIIANKTNPVYVQDNNISYPKYNYDNNYAAHKINDYLESHEKLKSNRNSTKHLQTVFDNNNNNIYNNQNVHDYSQDSKNIANQRAKMQTENQYSNNYTNQSYKSNITHDNYSKSNYSNNNSQFRPPVSAENYKSITQPIFTLAKSRSNKNLYGNLVDVSQSGNKRYSSMSLRNINDSIKSITLDKKPLKNLSNMSLRLRENLYSKPILNNQISVIDYHTTKRDFIDIANFDDIMGLIRLGFKATIVGVVCGVFFYIIFSMPRLNFAEIESVLQFIGYSCGAVFILLLSNYLITKYKEAVLKKNQLIADNCVQEIKRNLLETDTNGLRVQEINENQFVETYCQHNKINEEDFKENILQHMKHLIRSDSEIQEINTYVDGHLESLWRSK